MKVPFLDLKSQYAAIRHEIHEAIENVCENTAFVLGKAVADFEQAFAEKHNVKYCIGTSSGTDANHLVLWALGVGPGDEVIIPANTFIATAWGATLCGATPVFVDCEADSYNIDPHKVEAAITPKTKAIVAVHLYGQPADMDPLLEIAQKHNIYLVEDAAQAHLAEYKGQKVGNFGVATSFSFYPGKNLGAYGEAGAVITNDDVLAEKIRMMRDHGAYEKYSHVMYGHNYRMEGIQGAVLNVKLKYIEQWTEARRAVARKYREMLSDVNEIILPRELDYARHVYHLFVIQVKGENQKRDALREFLAEKGIASGLHYPIPLHLQKCFADLGYKRGACPNAELLAERGLSLPIYPELSEAQMLYLRDCLAAFFGD